MKKPTRWRCGWSRRIRAYKKRIKRQAKRSRLVVIVDGVERDLASLWWPQGSGARQIRRKNA